MTREHRDLMYRCLEDHASEEDWQAFAKLIGEDNDLLDLYCEEIKTCTALEWHYSIESNLKSVMRRKGELVAEMRRRQQQQAKRFGLAAAAVIFIFAGIYGSLRMIDSGPSATFVAEENAEWSVVDAKGRKSIEARLEKGDRVEITSGAIEISLENGVSALLDGAGSFTLVGEREVHLIGSRLFVQVPESKGHGFKVVTSALGVTDLGTRFGVDASLSAPHEVHVAEGRVQVVALQSGDRETLTTAQAVRVQTDDQLGRILPEHDKFRDSLSGSEDGFIRWSFDTYSSNGFHSSGTLPKAGNFPAAPQGPDGQEIEPQVVKGRSGMALKLTGEGDFAATSWDGLSEGEPFTIAVWFRAPQHSASDVQQKSGIPRRNLLSWGGFDQTAPTQGLAIDFPYQSEGLRAIATTFGSPSRSRVSNTAPLDENWHHFVVVSEGNQGADRFPEVTHYLDGVRIADNPRRISGTDPYPAPRPANPRMPLRFGIAALADPDMPTFAVTLDDIRIYRTALDEARVIQLFQSDPGS